MIGRALGGLALLVTLNGCDGGGAGDPALSKAGPQAAKAARSDPKVPAAASIDGLDPGWKGVEPGGETTCSDGSKYRFFVRPGDPGKLLVYFQGGGSCWLARNCDPHLDPTYKRTVGEKEPQRYDGIFDLEHPENPFAEYSIVMATYCTGDVHLGDNIASYQAPPGDDHATHGLEVRHRGIANVQAVLEWVYANFAAPAEIFVTGSSAGAIPSPYYAWQIAEHYPDARITQLGDAAGGYRQQDRGAGVQLERWGTLAYLGQYPEFETMTAKDFSFESLYIAAARRHPEVLFAEYDTAEDRVQRKFLAISGQEPESLKTYLDANQADIRAEVDNFRTFIAGGDSHTILARPQFYELRSGGVRIRDWVARLADHETVEDVTCSNCAEADGTTFDEHGARDSSEDR